MPVDPARVKSLFLAASDLPDSAERAAYVDRECDGDAELRRRVEALLRADVPVPVEATGTFGPDAAATADFPSKDGYVGAVLAGKYKLIEAIGAGGMGNVYMAQQTEPVKRVVAVKVIKAGMDSKTVLARFEAERQALAMMDHPNIARVFDAGVTDTGRPFFVMELVKGVPITQFCDDRKLTPRQRLELFIPVCQAIQHAHQKGVIHRDVKPNNVLVAMYDDRPVPKVIDFGVAKAAGPQLTDHTLVTGFGAVVGTPEYMSPEQASFNQMDVDTRSDVYALGVLLYELLTGTTPIDRKSLGRAAVLEVLRIVRENEPPRPSARLSTDAALPSIAACRNVEPSKLARMVRGELDWVVMKALEKDRTRRYETANALARDVQRYLADEIVEAQPPSRRYRLRKWAARNKVAIALSAILWSVFLSCTAFATWHWLMARDSERTAIREQQKAVESQAREADERRQAERLALSAAVDLDLEYCENRKEREGIVRLARTLKRLPLEALELRQNVTLNIIAWGQEIAQLVEFPPAIDHDTTRDGRFTIRQTPDASAELWETLTGKKLGTFGPKGSHRGDWGFDGADRTLMTSTSNSISLFDVATLQRKCEIRMPEDHHLDPFLSKDGTRLVIVSTPSSQVYDNPNYRTVVRLWDATDGKPISTLDHGGRPVTTCVWSRDSKTLLTVAGPQLRVWNSATGETIRNVDGHTEDIESVAFSPSGRFVATLSGKKIHWWDTATWTAAAPATALDVPSRPFDRDDWSRFDFPHDDVVIVVAWNMHGVGRVLGSAICLRGDSTAKELLALYADDRHALTHEGHVYELRPFRRIDSPDGHRFPDEIRTLANGRRFFHVDSYLYDFAVEKPIGRDLFRHRHAEIENLGFRSSSQLFTKTKLYPPADAAVPADLLELWAQVVARGELDPSSGLFVPLTEAEWDRRRRKLLPHEGIIPGFPFPGAPVTNPRYWLHKELSELTNRRETSAATLDRLVAEEPTWQNYSARASYRAYPGRDPIGAIHDDLKARELGKVEQQVYLDNGGRHAFQTIINDSNRPRGDYELAQKWFEKATIDPSENVKDTVGMCQKALLLFRLERYAEGAELMMQFLRAKEGELAAIAGVVGGAYSSQTHQLVMPHVIASACYRKLGRVESARREWNLALSVAEQNVSLTRKPIEDLADVDRSFQSFVTEVMAATK